MSLSYEEARQANIRRNNALLAELNLKHESSSRTSSKGAIKKPKAVKPALAPTRVSSRLASETKPRPSYSEVETARDSPRVQLVPGSRRSTGKAPRVNSKAEEAEDDVKDSEIPFADVASLMASWAGWEPEAGPPTRDADGTFHFDDEPKFTPNKSPAEVLREGAFGGGYYRPIRSRKLGVTVQGDWEELPQDWIEGLDIGLFLTARDYDPDINKFKVKCGQTIEEWEAAGWIRHEYDVRGWFQWYTRFFQGRRCDDDERQIGRWRKCVGETGRWRRMLLKKYGELGVRTVWDDGEEEDAPEVSPVMHQTCHHWAFEVRQETLDEFWAE